MAYNNKSSTRQRFMEHLEAKGLLPKREMPEEAEGMYTGGDIPDYPDGVGMRGENVSSGEPHMNSEFEEIHPESYEDGDSEMEHVFHAAHGGITPQGEEHMEHRAKGGFVHALRKKMRYGGGYA